MSGAGTARSPTESPAPGSRATPRASAPRSARRYACRGPAPRARTRHLVDGLAERLGQVLHAHRLALLLREVVEVALDRLGQLVAALDSLEPGLEQRCER